MMRSESTGANRAGFTLIEALAALAIGFAIIVATGALVRGVALSFDRGARSVGDAERVVLAIERLAGDFSSARFTPQMTETGLAVAAFTGDRENVTFVGAAGVGQLRDARSAYTREELVSLTVERKADGARLIRRRGDWPNAAATLGETEFRDTVVLLEGRLGIAFDFARRTPEDRLEWVTEWIRQPTPPRLVRLTIRNSATGAELIPAAEFIVRSDGSQACSTSNAGAECLSFVPKRSDAPAEGGRRRAGQ